MKHSIGTVEGIWPFEILGVNENIANLKGEYHASYNPALALNTEEDIWLYGGIKTYSTTADIDTLTSSNANDTVDIVIEGLDENWDAVTQTATLNGQTDVPLTTPLIRVNAMYNDSGTALVGNVYLFVHGETSGGVPTTATTIRRYIAIGYDRSLQSHISIPRYHVGVVTGLCYSIGGKKAGYTTFKFYKRAFGKVWLTEDPRDLGTTGTSSVDCHLPVPIILSPKSDFRVTANTSTADITGSAAISYWKFPSFGGLHDGS